MLMLLIFHGALDPAEQILWSTEIAHVIIALKHRQTDNEHAGFRGLPIGFP